MANEKTKTAEKQPTDDERLIKSLSKIERDAPRVRARERGQVNTAMEAPIDRLKELYPGKHFRWVRMPEHKNDHLQLTRRAAMGYQPVDRQRVIEEHGEDVTLLYGNAGGSLIRVGDVVLCEIDEELYEEEKNHRDLLAKEEAEKPERVYRDAVQGKADRRYLRSTGKIRRQVEDRQVTVGAPPDDEE